MIRRSSRAVATALVLACACAGSGAEAADSGAFVDASIGRAWNSGVVDADGTQWRASIGYRWALAPGVALGVDAGYADLGAVSHGTQTFYDGDAVGYSAPFDVDARGPTFGIDARFDIAPDWFVGARLGVQRVHLTSGAAHAAFVRDHDDAWYAGIGVGHDLGRAFSVGVRYDRVRLDIGVDEVDANQLGVFGEYRF